MTKLPLNDVRLFIQNTWPQPIIFSDKGKSQLFIRYCIREPLIAEEHGRCHQIQETHVREKDHHVPSDLS